MEKILTQEEIDALFRAAQGRASEKGKQPAEERALAVCNFHQSARISKEQLRSVSQLHELFARNLTRFARAYLRLTFEVNLVSAEQLNYGEFLQRIPEVTYLVSVALHPMGVSAAIEIDLPLAFPMIDVLLGGPGRAEATVREITEIEEQILESVVKIIGRELDNTWHPVLDVQFTFEGRLRQADISRLMPPSEKILSLSFEIRMPEARGMLNVALPEPSPMPFCGSLPNKLHTASSRARPIAPRKCAGALTIVYFLCSWSFPAKPCASRRSCL